MLKKPIKKIEWKILAFTDWDNILVLSSKRAFRRKFQIVEAFTDLAGRKGYHNVTHLDLARSCGITRQLVDHHFPTEELLFLIGYRYIYARYQKFTTDQVVTKADPLAQFESYLRATPAWINDYLKDARFLVQFFALSAQYTELKKAHERNLKIGQDRIALLLLQLEELGRLPRATQAQRLNTANSLQIYFAGYVTLTAIKSAFSKDGLRTTGDEFVKNGKRIVGLR